MDLPDFDIDVFYKGNYYMVIANIKQEGTYHLTDEWFEIDEEPEFAYSVYGEENPDDALCKKAIEMLTELYWDRKFR